MTTYTPGPWRVEDRPGKGYGKEFLVVTPRGPAFIGDQLKPNGISIGEARRNAKAAALVPRMADALRLAAGFVALYTGNGATILESEALSHYHKPGGFDIDAEAIAAHCRAILSDLERN